MHLWLHYMERLKHNFMSDKQTKSTYEQLGSAYKQLQYVARTFELPAYTTFLSNATCVDILSRYVDEYARTWLRQCKINDDNMPRKEKAAQSIFAEAVRRVLQHFVKRTTSRTAQQVYDEWVCAIRPHVTHGGRGHAIHQTVDSRHHAIIYPKHYDSATEFTFIRALAAMATGHMIPITPVVETERWGN